MAVLSLEDLVRMEAASVVCGQSRHKAAVAHAARGIFTAIGDRAVVWSQAPFALGRCSSSRADLVLLKPKEDCYASEPPGRADVLLILEVADFTLDVDRRTRARLYADALIHEYWIVELATKCLLVHTNPDQKTYRLTRELHCGESVAPRLLPDCRIPVRDLFGL